MPRPTTMPNAGVTKPKVLEDGLCFPVTEVDAATGE